MTTKLEILPSAIRQRGAVESAHGIAVLTVCEPSAPATVRRELKAALQRAAQSYDEPLCNALLALLYLHAKHTRSVANGDRANLAANRRAKLRQRADDERHHASMVAATAAIDYRIDNAN